MGRQDLQEVDDIEVIYQRVRQLYKGLCQTVLPVHCLASQQPAERSLLVHARRALPPVGYRPRYQELATMTCMLDGYATGARQPVSAGEMTARLARWISGLTDRSRPLAEIDERLIQALDVSQADAGLGAHVTPGAGELGYG